jgi:SNF2 family DNA or RNA helicase
MGTGKTLIGLVSLARLHKKGDKFVVVAANGNTGTWVEEARKFKSPLRVVRVVGTSDQRRDIISFASWDVLVISYDAVRRLWPEVVAMKPVGVIFDEIQNVKNRTAQRTVACRRVASAVKGNKGFIVGMTGTPIEDKPFDLWSECDILWPGRNGNQHILGYGNYRGFVDTVAVTRIDYYGSLRVPVYSFPEKNLLELKRRFSQFAIEERKETCLDLPEKTFQLMRLDLNDEQQEVYSALVEDSVAFLTRSPLKASTKRRLTKARIASLFDQDLGIDPTKTISAAMAVTLRTRLHQIAAGHAKLDDGQLFLFANGAKEGALLENLEGWTARNHKVVIFHQFTADIAIIERACVALKLPYVTLNGRNSKDAALVQAQFQSDPKIKVFIAQLDVGSTGLTLHAADYMTFYTISDKMGKRRQAIDRIHRIGQTRNVHYTDLIASRTVDEFIYANNINKIALADLTVRGLIASLTGDAD